MDYEYYRCAHCEWIGAAPVGATCPNRHGSMDLVKDPELRKVIERDIRATLAGLKEMQQSDGEGKRA
jgi:hypothetical protein